MKSRLLIKKDYQGNTVFYFPVPDIARAAGFGPYLDFIGPYISEGDARQDEKRMIRKASLMVLHDSSGSAVPDVNSKTNRERLRMEGYQARQTDAGIETCPYPFTKRTAYYWLLGWWQSERGAQPAPSLLEEEMLNSPKKKASRRRRDIRRQGRPGDSTLTNDPEGVKTQLYFSTGSKPDPLDMKILREAGAGHLLVSYPLAPGIGEWTGHKILYGDTLQQLPSDFELETYLEFSEAHQDEYEFALAYEIPGDSEATRTLWLKTTGWLNENLGDTPVEGWPHIIPVWNWGGSLDLLDHYLQESHLVAIGGSLPHLLLNQDRGVLQDLIALCCQYKDRFHIRQCEWALAVEQLAGIAHSIDTSVWRNGYTGAIIFQDAKTGLVHTTPATVLPEYKKLSRHSLCVKNIQNLISLVEAPHNQVVSLTRCSVCGGNFNSKGRTDRKCCTPSCAAFHSQH